MGIIIKCRITIPLLFILLFTACGDLDITGMFVTDGSVEERYTSSMAYNATHPFKEINSPTNDYKIFVMGDSHIGDTVNIHRFFKDAQTSNALAAVLNGDLCTGRAEDYLKFNSTVPHPDSLLSFKLVGNHELYFDGWNSFKTLYGTSMYYFSVSTPTAKDLYICLDAGSGTLGKAQLNWFRDVLRNTRPAYRNCVVFMHVNLFRIRRTLSTNPNNEELLALNELFAVHRVNMVVTGHDHLRNVTQMGNTKHITMDALLDGHPKAGYLILKNETTGLKHQFMNY